MKGRPKITLLFVEFFILISLYSLILIVSRYSPGSLLGKPYRFEGREWSIIKEYYSLESPLFPIYIYRVIEDNSLQRRLGMALTLTELSQTPFFSTMIRAFSGDFGPSLIWRRRTAGSILASGIGNSALYILPALLVALIIALTPPLLRAARRFLGERRWVVKGINLSLLASALSLIAARNLSERWFQSPLPEIIAFILLTPILLNHGNYMVSIRKIPLFKGIHPFAYLLPILFPKFISCLVIIEYATGVPGIFHLFGYGLFRGDYSIIFPLYLYLSTLYLLLRLFTITVPLCCPSGMQHLL